MSQHYQHDVLVIGSGAAGLSLALTLPEHLRIAVLSKGELSQGSTYWAPVSYTHLAAGNGQRSP